jgi:hypothetical protein
MNLLDLLGPATPGKLAECNGLTTGGVTVMLDRLEKGCLTVLGIIAALSRKSPLGSCEST